MLEANQQQNTQNAAAATVSEAAAFGWFYSFIFHGVECGKFMHFHCRQMQWGNA